MTLDQERPLFFECPARDEVHLREVSVAAKDRRSPAMAWARPSSSLTITGALLPFASTCWADRNGTLSPSRPNGSLADDD